MTQPYSFNLVDEAWLPCRRPDGRAVTLSLRETLVQAHELTGLAGDSPPQTASLHRFLLAVLHRVFGPADEDEWADLWRAGRFDTARLDAYLDRWRPRFDLFDPKRPFYQTATLYLESKWVSFQRLIHELNAAYPLFNHSETETKEFLLPAEAARTLITAQNFSLCGTSGAFFPQKSPREKKIQSMFVDGSIVRAINFLILGDSLFETLMLNLIQYPDEQVVAHFDDDAPTWEQEDPSSPDRKPLLGYLDYLTWQNRRILLRPEMDPIHNLVVRQMRWEPANRIGATLLDPMQHHIKNIKEGYKLLYFDKDKGMWRDSAALFSLHHSSENNPPATFRWLYELTRPDTGYLEKQRLYRCLALGMSSKPGQATVYFYREESIPLPLDYFQEPELVEKLRYALDRTEEVFRNLRFAAQVMGMHLYTKTDIKNEIKTWQTLKQITKNTINNWVAFTGAERHYWTSLEVPFQSFMVNLAAEEERDPVLLVWLERLKTTALDAFDRAAGYAGSDGRSFKAVVRGRSYLNYRLNQLFPKKEETV